MDREQLGRLSPDERAWLAELPFRLSVEGAFRVTGRGTVIAGVVEQGRVRPGDELELVRPGRGAQGRACQVRCVRSDVIHAPNRDPSLDSLVGVVVTEVAPGDVSLGDVLQARTAGG